MNKPNNCFLVYIKPKNIIPTKKNNLYRWIFPWGFLKSTGKNLFNSILIINFSFQDSNVISSIVFVFILGVFSSAIAQTLFNKFVKIASPLFASAVTYTMPIVAIFWAILDGETLTLMQFFATAIILAGVYMVNKKKKSN